VSEGPQRPGDDGDAEADAADVRVDAEVDQVDQVDDDAAPTAPEVDAAAASSADPAPTAPEADAAVADPAEPVEPEPTAAEGGADQPPAAALPPVPPPVPPRAPRNRALTAVAVLALILSLLLLVAFAVPAWFLYRGDDVLARLPSPTIERLERRADDFVDDLADARRDAREALDREAELRQGLDALGNAFTALSADFAADDPIDDRQWRLAETAYLLRVANLRSGMEDDREGAEALLRAADELLREIDDFGLVPVREAIAVALADLQSAPAVDRVGLYLELEGLGEQIDELRPDRRIYAAPPVLKVPVTDSEDWLSAVRSRFEGLIDFRVHRPEPIRTLTSPQETSLLRHNLALKLEQAQLALLQRDGVVWRRSLEDAGVWAKDWFDGSDPAAQQLLAALERLAAEQVDIRAPDISAPHTELLRLRARARFLEPLSNIGSGGSRVRP